MSMFKTAENQINEKCNTYHGTLSHQWKDGRY